MDKYRVLFTEAAAESPPNSERARYAWAEMHRAKKRKGYLDFYPRELDVDAALVKLRLARRVMRNGHEYTDYAPSYGALFRDEDYDMSPNGGYYVWVIDKEGKPLLEGPYGPHERGAAESLARIGATKGSHDRVVTRSRQPTDAGFKLVAEYEAGTGRKTEL
jgi:hypothetical protein